MDELLKNNSQKKEKLKEIIKKLHKGAAVQEIKKEFSKIIKDVSPEEISDIESALLDEGVPAEEIQRLCDVHVEVFKEALLVRKKNKGLEKIPGHPVHTYIQENKTVKKMLKDIKPLVRKISRGKADDNLIKNFRKGLDKIKQIDKHFLRKENQLFPFLEKKGFYGPAKVMWGKHDEVRVLFKKIDKALNENDMKEIGTLTKGLIKDIKGMIFKEEKILFPVALKKLTEEDWIKIHEGEKEMGYAWIDPGILWQARLFKLNISRDSKEEKIKEENADGIKLQEGVLNAEQLNLLLKNLPFDVTFVDENDKVRYYTDSTDRIFPRSPGIIGRAVQNCHPPKSVHVVTEILESFRKKEKKSADFWLELGGKFIYIRYFPVYDDSGNYKGVIEVSQDVTGIRSLKGEKRLLD